MLPPLSKTATRGVSSRHWVAILAALVATSVVSYQLAKLITANEIKVLARENHMQTLAMAEKTIDASVIAELYHAISEERLTKIATQYKAEYAAATPFPHIAIDNIFPVRFLEQVINENPESLTKDGCLKSAKVCFQESTQRKKSAVEREDMMGVHTKILFSAMKSSNFIHFLEELTGIEQIIPDPHYRGSGLHIIGPGGNLDIHADFNKYHDYKLDRRVNSFIFLNPEWPEDYGGHLELWSRDMESCHQRILPTLGRFVVFSSTDFTYHGHPQPLACPEDRARRSMALHYYTNGRPSDECLNGDCTGRGHSTLFQTPVGCEICEESSCKAYQDDFDVPVAEEKP